MTQTEDQREVTDFLADPAVHACDGPVEVIETHISRVFLADDRAFKLKRAVRLPYADFSTAPIRLAACQRELELNRRTAPQLYLDVRRITRGPDGALRFGGEGPLVDAVVEMHRFDQADRLDHVAERGALTPDLLDALADGIAAFHADAPVIHGEGGAENIAAVLDINRAGFATSTVFPEEEVAALDSTFRAALAVHAATLDAREAAGLVRRCHGDLHLANLCLIDGHPVPFDCIDFNDRIATVDVLYDLAFLLMDLWENGCHAEANRLANRYFDRAEEGAGADAYALMPFFMALRAAVRAHVTATRAETADGDAARNEARRHFDLARALLSPKPPRAVGFGGFSGSGKTTLAQALAADLCPPPGARLIESDLVRKAMFGVPPDTRLSPDAYRPEVSAEVYRAMADRAAETLAAGMSVIVGAVHDLPETRQALSERLSKLGRFDGIWLDVPPLALRTRVETRAPGASDATAEVLERQLSRDPGPMGWQRIPAAGMLEATLAAIRAALDLG